MTQNKTKKGLIFLNAVQYNAKPELVSSWSGVRRSNKMANKPDASLTVSAGFSTQYALNLPFQEPSGKNPLKDNKIPDCNYFNYSTVQSPYRFKSRVKSGSLRSTTTFIFRNIQEVQ